MSNQDAKQVRAKPLHSLSGNLLQLFRIDFLLNVKAFLRSIIFNVLILLFGILVWIILNAGLFYYLQLQAVSALTIFTSLLLINLAGLAICIFLSYWQSKKIRFYYTQCAIKKLTNTIKDII